MRRALAIQLIINRELGLAKNENPLQGSFVIEELTDLVEEAVLVEFERLSIVGECWGRWSGSTSGPGSRRSRSTTNRRRRPASYPVVGVNTFLSKEGSPFVIPEELIRSTDEDKDRQIANVRAFQKRNRDRAERALAELQQVAVSGGNVFAQLMETAKVASLGQMSQALYEVGGRYRRNM